MNQSPEKSEISLEFEGQTHTATYYVEQGKVYVDHINSTSGAFIRRNTFNLTDPKSIAEALLRNRLMDIKKSEEEANRPGIDWP